MFWSSPGDIVTQANMDGTNATLIIASEDVYGLYLDELTEKLYWANLYGKSIGHRDLQWSPSIVVGYIVVFPYSGQHPEGPAEIHWFKWGEIVAIVVPHIVVFFIVVQIFWPYRTLLCIFIVVMAKNLPILQVCL